MQNLDAQRRSQVEEDGTGHHHRGHDAAQRVNAGAGGQVLRACCLLKQPEKGGREQYQCREQFETAYSVGAVAAEGIADGRSEKAGEPAADGGEDVHGIGMSSELVEERGEKDLADPEYEDPADDGGDE